jgi:hypothetical protein
MLSRLTPIRRLSDRRADAHFSQGWEKRGLGEKRIQPDAGDDRIHIKGHRGLFRERLTLNRIQNATSGRPEFDSALIQESIHKRSGKQKAPNRLVCLEFPPAASVRPLSFPENIFGSAQYAPLVLSKIREIVLSKEGSMRKTVTRLMSNR